MRTAAVVFRGPGEVALDEIEMPDEPGEGQVRVRTSFSTVSVGTEGWVLRDVFGPDEKFPCAAGYQRVGVVTAVGPGVEGIALGQRVVTTVGSWKGPVQPLWGSHTAHSDSWTSQTFPVPDGADDIDAAGAVVLQVGYNAAFRAAQGDGARVLVYGDGIIGQFAAQAARARGARQVILVGHRPERLELAERHSADHALNSHDGDVAARVKELTGGEPVDVVLDSVQTEATLDEYAPLIRFESGEVVYCGWRPEKTWADQRNFMGRCCTVHHVGGWSRERIAATLALCAEGQMSARPLTTHLVPFAEAPAMYRMIQEKGAPFLSVTFDWRGAA